jgi:hypothetical protein
MKTDSQLQQDAIAELKWEPRLGEAEIGVAAKDGVITLTGTVDGYAKKAEAEDAVKRVAGVKAVVEKIEVKYAGDWAKKDDGDRQGHPGRGLPGIRRHSTGLWTHGIKGMKRNALRGMPPEFGMSGTIWPLNTDTLDHRLKTPP